MNGKILIIGHARHGKDTVANMLRCHTGLRFEGSSEAAARIFLFDSLREKYGYKSIKECFDDRVNRRSEWFELICEYNKNDKARLAKQILEHSDIYVGMRSSVEVDECIRQGIFNIVIGVYDPRKDLEPAASFDIDFWKYSDVVISNAGDLEELDSKVKALVWVMKYFKLMGND